MKINRIPATMAAILMLLASATAQVAEQQISAPIAFFDDADVISPGVLSVSSDFSYGSVAAGHDTSFPASYATLGLTRRMHLSGGTSYVRSVYEDTGVNGIGDTYVGLKFVLIPESDRLPGLAVKPSLEVLGTPSVHDNPLAPGRPNFLIPVMLQKSFDTWRSYYTTGYLTRGITFHALAWEWNGWSRVTPTVLISHGRIHKDADFISELGLNQSRSDVLLGAGIYLAPGWGAYGNVSRSFGRSDPNSLRYQVSAGLSYTLRLWGEP